MGKNKIGMILIIALLVILLILFGAGFWLLYSTINKANDTESNNTYIEEISEEDITIFSVGESSVITNLLEGPDKKKHVIKIKVSLGINNSKKKAKDATELITLLETKQPFLKDTIINICRNKTFEELNRNDAQAIIKDEMLLRLKEAFKTDLIVKVYIDEIILD